MAGNDDHQSVVPCFSFLPTNVPTSFDPCWMMHFWKEQILLQDPVARGAPEKRGLPISQETTENRDFHLILAYGCIQAPPHQLPAPSSYYYADQVREGELPSALHFLLRLPVESIAASQSMKWQAR